MLFQRIEYLADDETDIGRERAGGRELNHDNFAFQHTRSVHSQAHRKTNHKFNSPLWFVLSPPCCSHPTHPSTQLKAIVVHSLDVRSHSISHLLCVNVHFEKFIAFHRISIFVVPLTFRYFDIYFFKLSQHFRYALFYRASVFASICNGWSKRDDERHTTFIRLYFLV